MKTITVSIRGIRPLIMHNGRLADPLNEWTKKLKSITSKRKKTDDDLAEASQIEWQGGLYYSDELGVYIPNDNLESAFVAGAKKTKLGKAAQAGIFVEDNNGSDYYGTPITAADGTPYKDIEAMKNDPRFSLRNGVRVQQSRIMRTRPMLPSHWRATFPVTFDEELLNIQDIERIIADTGRFIGLGDWRPKFGRFIIETFNGEKF